MITDIATGRCMRASEEMLTAWRNLRIQTDNIESICMQLRQMESESMMIAAAKLERMAGALGEKTDTVRTLGLALNKISGMYRRTETEVADHGDEVMQTARVNYRRADMGPVLSAAEKVFEEF